MNLWQKGCGAKDPHEHTEYCFVKHGGCYLIGHDPACYKDSSWFKEKEMSRSGPCLCGDPECPSCFPQGDDYPPDYEGMVAQFHLKHRHQRPGTLTLPDSSGTLMRLRLIMEEAGELAQAMHKGVVAGRFPEVPGEEPETTAERIEASEAEEEEALVLIADALADLLYVTFGTAIAYGIPIGRVFEEVHRSNMSKAQLDECSKGGKGVGFSAPDLRSALGLSPRA